MHCIALQRQARMRLFLQHNMPTSMAALATALGLNGTKLSHIEVQIMMHV